MRYYKNIHASGYITCCEQCKMREEEIEEQEADTMTMPEWAAFHGFANLQLLN